MQHPLAHLHSDKRLSSVDRMAPLKRARILIAEDEVIVAMDIQFTLEDAGAEVIGPAHTLSEAVHFAEDEEIDAAILDMRLGHDLSGSVARILAGRGIPFLFYTGQTATDPLRAEWPDAPLLQKPAPTQQLVGAVAELLDR